MQEDIIKRRDSTEGLRKVGMLEKEDIVKGRDDAGGRYIKAGCCRRTL